jgi:hypothetical protein
VVRAAIRSPRVTRQTGASFERAASYAQNRARSIATRGRRGVERAGGGGDDVDVDVRDVGGGVIGINCRIAAFDRIARGSG